jgi:hypothetical protein
MVEAQELESKTAKWTRNKDTMRRVREQLEPASITETAPAGFGPLARVHKP